MSYLDAYQQWTTPAVDDSFKDLAACRNADPSLFFPDGPGGHPKSRWEAHQYCRNCPVTAECLDYALTVNNSSNDWGIWAGTNANQRRALRAEANRRTA